MNKQQIKEAAAKASEDYMENAPFLSGPRGSYRKGFIAGAEFIADYLCKLPLNLAVKQLHDYCKEKLGTEKEKKL